MLIFCLDYQKSGNLEAIQIIKKLGGKLSDSYLDDVSAILEVCYLTVIFHISGISIG
jgi:hypothetical protein